MVSELETTAGGEVENKRGGRPGAEIDEQELTDQVSIATRDADHSLSKPGRIAGIEENKVCGGGARDLRDSARTY